MAASSPYNDLARARGSGLNKGLTTAWSPNLRSASGHLAKRAKTKRSDEYSALPVCVRGVRPGISRTCAAESIALRLIPCTSPNKTCFTGINWKVVSTYEPKTMLTN
eukprot:3886680-Pyramimonas_sp.AAC.1